MVVEVRGESTVHTVFVDTRKRFAKEHSSDEACDGAFGIVDVST
jgi:hypothetical protein